MIEIQPRGGLPLEGISKVLRQLKSEAINLRSSGSSLLRENYLAWVSTAAMHLRSRLSGPKLAQLVYTPHYFAISQSATTDPALYSTISAELQVLVESLDEMIATVTALQRHWEIGGTFVVPDTNILVHTAKTFDQIDWASQLQVHDVLHLVIPMVVVDELDGLKRTGKAGTAIAARRTLNVIESLLVAPTTRADLPRIGAYVPVTVEVLAEPLDHRRLPRADNEIIARAVWLKDLGCKVLFVTWDTTPTFRARQEGLAVGRLPESEQRTPPSKS